MPERRPRTIGSFGGHFDGLVAQFPPGDVTDAGKDPAAQRRKKLQEKIDIHAMLFEQAWQLES